MQARITRTAGVGVPNLALRVHLALSWLNRAEQLANGGDEDGRLIFLWIAFNAACATEIDERYRLSEPGTFRVILQKLADLDAANKAAHAALGQRDTLTVLSVVLPRIYTLRNQLMHGGATWNSWVNRNQIRDCTSLMGKLVPVVIEISSTTRGLIGVMRAIRWWSEQRSSECGELATSCPNSLMTSP